MKRFVAFDVETPNRRNDRMSAIGITVIEGGVIVDEFYSLVNPETYFDAFNSKLTGIDTDTVRDAPNFLELWGRIEPVMSSGILVAHNAVFDMGVLRKCLRYYDVEWKRQVSYLCTVQMGKHFLPGMSHKLDVLCDYYGIALDHHQAASDSHACGEILIKYMECGDCLERYIKDYSL